MNLADEQNAHRADLDTWPATDREWARNHVAIAERHAAAEPRVVPNTETCGQCGRRLP